jgi:hypothetical protein
MAVLRPEDVPDLRPARLLFIVLVVLIVFVILVVVRKVAVFVEFVVLFFDFIFLILFVVDVVGDGIQRDRMRLRNLQLGLALRATQNLSLFHFVFVHINFRGTLRAAEHVSILRFGLVTGTPSASRTPPEPGTFGAKNEGGGPYARHPV